MQSSKSSNSIAIGRVAKPHGVRGALRVVPYDAESDTLAAVEQVTIGGREYTIENARWATDAWLVELEGVTTRDQAAALRGTEVEVAREELELEEGEYLVGDLVGCAAFDPGGRPLGTVREVFHNGAQDVLVLDDDHMVPLVDEWVVVVDLAARRIVVEPHDAF